MKKLILNLLIIIAGIFVIIYNPFTCKLITLIWADLNEIDRDKYYRLVQAESSFRPWVKSRSGAIGLGQVHPNTAKYIAPNEFFAGALWIPTKNLEISIKYLQYLLRKYDQNWSLALAAYNWGESNVDRKIKAHKIIITTSENYQYLFKNIRETHNYLNKILSVEE